MRIIPIWWNSIDTSIGHGGSVFISGGSSKQGVGGQVSIVSGYSDSSQAFGDTLLATADGRSLRKAQVAVAISKLAKVMM